MAGVGWRSSPACLTSPTTPTISRRPCLPNRSRCPTGSVAVRPVLAGQRFIDHRNQGPVGFVEIVEPAAAAKRHAHGAEVVGADGPVVGREALAGGQGSPILDGEAHGWESWPIAIYLTVLGVLSLIATLFARETYRDSLT